MKIIRKKKFEFGGDFQAGVYAMGGSLQAHGIKVGDTFIRTVSGVIQKVKDKDGKIVYINLSNGERDSQPPLPFEKGGLIKSKIDKLYMKSNFINDDYNWKLKLLEMLQDKSIEAYNIYQSLNKVEKEEVLEELYIMDNDMGSYGDNDIETSKENLSILLEDAKNGNKYDDGGEVGMQEEIDLTDDNRLRVKKPAMPTRNVSNQELAEKYNPNAYEFMNNDKKYFVGGLFSKDKILPKAKKYPNLEDKDVVLKNGKVVKVFSQSNNELTVMEFSKMGSGERPTKVDISEVETVYKNGGELIGNQYKIDLNKNGKIDAEDFKLLRSSMNGAWRKDRKYVNHNEDYEVRYSKPRPSRTGYKGNRKFVKGGALQSGSINYLSDLWFAVQQKDVNEYKMLSNELDKLNVPYAIQNEVSADSETQRGRKALNIPEVHERITKIVQRNNRKFALGGDVSMKDKFQKIVSKNFKNK